MATSNKKRYLVDAWTKRLDFAQHALLGTSLSLVLWCPVLQRWPAREAVHASHVSEFVSVLNETV